MRDIARTKSDCIKGIGIPVSHLSYDNGFRALLKQCQKPEIFKPVSFILFLAVQTPYQPNITQAGSSKNFMKVLHKASHLAAHFAALEWLWPQGLCKWSNSEMENDGRCKPFHCIPKRIVQNMVWIWALRLLQVHPIWHQRRARAARLCPFDGTLASSHCWGSLFRQKLVVVMDSCHSIKVHIYHRHLIECTASDHWRQLLLFKHTYDMIYIMLVCFSASKSKHWKQHTSPWSPGWTTSPEP